jgi:hypothetical protein
MFFLHYDENEADAGAARNDPAGKFARVGWPESYRMAVVALASRCGFPKLQRNFNSIRTPC